MSRPLISAHLSPTLRLLEAIFKSTGQPIKHFRSLIQEIANIHYEVYYKTVNNSGTKLFIAAKL